MSARRDRQGRALAQVRDAHGKLEAARRREREASDRFVLALGSARAAGLTLHEIGEAVGLSLGRIAQLTRTREEEGDVRGA